jgi:hypothetical protein
MYYWALFGKVAAGGIIVWILFSLLKKRRRRFARDIHAADPIPNRTEPITPELKAYRESQLKKANKSQSEYDKLVVTLSGGALGVSFTFLKDVLHRDALQDTIFLPLSWACWSASLACILVSLFTGIGGLRKAVAQVDDGTIYESRPGGILDFITAKILNPAAGVFFILGLVFMIAFVWLNPV